MRVFAYNIYVCIVQYHGTPTLEWMQRKLIIGLLESPKDGREPFQIRCAKCHDGPERIRGNTTGILLLPGGDQQRAVLF